MNYELLFSENKTKTLFGRYLSLTNIESILCSLNTNNQLKIVGQSVLRKPIYEYKIGYGPKKILLWSQMHGNESTTTKALFDFLHVLHSKTEFATYLLENFTFSCIPMLNPDGAAAYTRENANNIDLNRDFQALSQPESQLLMQVFNNFKPHYCYNLHDQRTIYGAGDSGKPATVSFLSPAFNENRDFNTNRIEACRIINAMNFRLQKDIPNQIGRFDDSFNNNCVGECFQEKGVPTILFEAGHYQNDYDREITRKHIFCALISSFNAIYDFSNNDGIINNYLDIPQNKVIFYDIILKNVKFICNYNKIIINIAIQFKEELIDEQIIFVAYIVGVGELVGFFGHLEIDTENFGFIDKTETELKINEKASFEIGTKIKIKNGKIIKM
jgi:hypothetical protein